MPRYSRIPNGPELDSEADADSVALMQSQAPPRKYGGSHRSAEYVALDELDEHGRPLRDAPNHEIAIEMRNSSRRLLMIVVGIGIALIFGGMAGSWYHRTHRVQHTPEHFLVRPLPRTELTNGTHTFNRTTLVLSLDGLHPHYVSTMRMPRVDTLVKHGCAVPYMEPSFPTQTFPNHWTLVTGQFPINHGIIGNTFYDPEIDLEFVNTDPEKSLDPRYWGGEPVWQTAAKHGLRSAVHMWPGSEVDLAEGKPDYMTKFDAAEPLDTKASKIIEWLDMEHPPEIMLAYVPTVDTVGHQVGIRGSELVAACMEADSFVGKIVDALAERNLTDVVNLVVVSDHGMSPTSNNRLVFLDETLSNWDNVTSNRGWPLAGLRFEQPSQLEEAYESAKKRSLAEHKFRVFKSEDLPRRWKFTTAPLNSPDPERPSGPGNDYEKQGTKRAAHAGRAKRDEPDAAPEPIFGRYKHRLAPLYLVPEIGYVMLTHDEWEEANRQYPLAGVHGYDNRQPLMRALFVAQGPAFPPGRYHPFPNVDVYSAICRSVGIPESKDSDGDFSLWPLSPEKVKEEYPGDVNFQASPMVGSTFESF